MANSVSSSFENSSIRALNCLMLTVPARRARTNCFTRSEEVSTVAFFLARWEHCDAGAFC
jgi:hypothetical protein